MSDAVARALEELFAQYCEIDSQREELNKSLAQLDAKAARLQPKIIALAVASESEIDPTSALGKFLTEVAATGLTDGIRMVLKGSSGWMSPTDIRTGLLRLGYNLAGYSNVMASIHQVLKRLRESKEVRRGVRKPGREIVYRWAALGPSADDNQIVDEEKEQKEAERIRRIHAQSAQGGRFRPAR